eukprot:scaffold18856_cov82-Skeletonema_dohrnii-CCMP3373.AAC.2
MIRRLNLSKAKSKSTYIKEEERYHRQSNDDEFVCEVLCDADDADVIWESLSSLTLQDYALQSRRMRRSTSFMMLDASPDQITSNSLLNDTISRVHPMPLSSELLSTFQDYWVIEAIMEGSRYTLPAHMVRHPTSSTSVSACVPSPLKLRMTMAELHSTSCANHMQKLAPSAIIIEDDYGVDVVEYALEADMSMTFIRLLQDMVARVHEHNAKKKASRKLMQARSQLEQKDTFCMACD